MNERLFALVVRAEPALADAIGSILFESGAGGLEELDAGGAVELRVYATERAEAERLARIVEVYRCSPGENGLAIGVEVIEITGSRWQSRWTDYLVQERLTERLVVQPVTDPTPAPPGTRRIVFEPQLVFGVGSHPTTRLAARAVERHTAAHPDCTVLDVGTGSGVLAFVAALGGAGRVTGIDVDPAAVEAARHNAQLNGISVSFSEANLESLDNTFALVVANIETSTLLALAPALARRTRESLVLSGILEEQAGAIGAAFSACGLGVCERECEDGWVLLTLRAYSDTAREQPPRVPG